MVCIQIVIPPYPPTLSPVCPSHKSLSLIHDFGYDALLISVLEAH